ncbi:unnamed protein product [Coregonus sp. 'balchen']|nr:unnamed protein product [Coregonus sp. 'balchen']
MSWHSRVWPSMQRVGSASVEVEVEAIEDATKMTVQRKTVDRDGPKASRLTASCLRNQPILRLHRLDIRDMWLPESSRTLSLRRGRRQAEAMRSQRQKKRGRKKILKIGSDVTNKKTEAKGVNGEPSLDWAKTM